MCRLLFKHESGRHETASRYGGAASNLFHPDYTVGPGVTPDLLTFFGRAKKPLAGYTAGGELRPALRITGIFRRGCLRGQLPLLQAATMTSPRKAPIARSAARLGAVQALYQMDIGNADLSETLAQFSARATGEDFDDGQCGEADYKHLREVVEGAVREQALIDVTLDKQLDKDWPIHRVNAILRAVLRAGAFELMFNDNVPARVAINEYVNVAAAFFDADEPALANAVLNALARIRRPEEFKA
jgi:N utilization substance protein B